MEDGYGKLKERHNNETGNSRKRHNNETGNSRKRHNIEKSEVVRHLDHAWRQIT